MNDNDVFRGSLAAFCKRIFFYLFIACTVFDTTDELLATKVDVDRCIEKMHNDTDVIKQIKVEKRLNGRL